MARARSPDRDRAFEMWCNSDGKMKLKDIAEALGVSDSKIRKWKSMDKWDEQLNGTLHNMKGSVPHEKKERSNKGGAPKGNQNAKGNHGGAPKGNQNAVGHGPPLRNSNAVVTGEYQSIWDELLTEKERKLMLHVPTEVMTQLVIEIKRFELREFRMMERIAALRDEERVVQTVTKTQTEDSFGKSRSIVAIEEDSIEKIQRIEEALTRIQEKKGKYLELKFKLEQTEKENGWKEAELSRAEQNLLIKLEELAIKQEKLALDKTRIMGNGEEETEDDGLMEQLNNASGVWSDYDDGE
ncbi:phage terminase small subunit [Aneurinibacillus aneurinilyticus]|uniref:phage terminase small subunit n=1 Tax=Aneurinibacillus aneurinilyticus TaxID=1391 RepID=UPI0023F04E1A|nr:phage terminase small subunit [Aneurinibacillus aneurinilyticus]